MEIDARMQGDVLVLGLRGPRLDASRAVGFKERMRFLTERHDGRIQLDMGAIDFLDSSGLGALVAVMKSLGGGRSLELVACADPVRKVLVLTRMDRVFTLRDAVAGDPGSTAA